MHCYTHAGDCGEPLVDSSLNLTYNSTLEGSRVEVLCDRFVATALCHRNGSWSPHLTDSVCNLTSPLTTGKYIGKQLSQAIALISSVHCQEITLAL